MNFNARGFRLLWFAVVLFSGCGGSALKTVDNSGLATLSATPDELVAHVNDAAASIAALKGKLEMGLREGDAGDVRRCRGMLLSRNGPARGLYLKGYRRLIPTFFTLVSDGIDFWFHIPRDDVVYTGSVEFTWSRDDSLEIYLNSGDLFRALFVQPLDGSDEIEVKDSESVYALSAYSEGRLQRRLWIERKRFSVIREVYYDNNGTETLEILRERYADIDGRLYPATLVLHDAVSGSTVFLDFEAITLDPVNVDDSVFQFRVPNGVDVKYVE